MHLANAVDMYDLVFALKFAAKLGAVELLGMLAGPLAYVWLQKLRTAGKVAR